jgi:hypothetical protein
MVMLWDLNVKYAIILRLEALCRLLPTVVTIKVQRQQEIKLVRFMNGADECTIGLRL